MMEDKGSTDRSTEGLSRAEVNDMIHRRRKVRYGTACYPCRTRKVKCDNQQPCNNCVKRDHANLCSYNPKQDSQQTAAFKPLSSSSISSVQSSRKRALSTSYDLDTNSKEIDPARSEPGRWQTAYDEDEPPGQRYVGENSTHAFLSKQTRTGDTSINKAPEVIRQDILPALGMHVSSSPYPFMPNENVAYIRQQIFAALPPDQEILQKFQAFRQVIDPLWHLLMDADEFEAALLKYLEERSSKRTFPSGKGVTMAWLGSLFSVLAMATQYCDMPGGPRVSLAQTYVQVSMQCLRLANYLLRPTLDSIQALLIVGQVLANDMKAEASWAFLGLSSRLAQILGLHRNGDRLTKIPPKLDLPRRRLWWTLVWQDSLLSLTFDRTPVIAMTQCDAPISTGAAVDGLTYKDALFRIAIVINEVRASTNDDSSMADFGQILADTVEIEKIRRQVNPRIQHKNNCRTFQDKVQCYALSLHISFVISILCRPALSRSEVDATRAPQKELVAEKCRQNLIEVVRMFLSMHTLSTIPTRTWSFTHHGVSSAVLLGILGGTKSDPEVKDLQRTIIDVLSAVLDAKETSPAQSGFLSQALRALRNMYEHGRITDLPPATSEEVASVPRPEDQAHIEQQNAALAMTSLQNGNDGAPMNIGFTSQLEPMPIEASCADQPKDMSPMELFDSIFWGSAFTGNTTEWDQDYSQQPMYQY